MADELEFYDPKDRDIPVVITKAYVNNAWTDKEAGKIVDGHTIGYDAFASLAPAIAAVTEDGTIEVVGGEISFSDGYCKSITVDAGATVVGTAIFTSPITINGTIAFDTAFATSTEAQFGGFSYVSGDATYTLTDAVPATGTYLLASDAAAFSSDIAFNGCTLTVGGMDVVIGDFEYTLVITYNNELALTVTELVPPPPPVVITMAYVNSEWKGLADGDVVTVGETTATIGYDAFATGDIGIANVPADGTVEVVAGEVSFTNTTAKAITIDTNATLVGKATFGTDITINGTIAFDTAYCNAYNAQFGGFSYVSGDAAYTLTDAVPATGTYLLATDAAGFDKTIAFRDETLTVGGEPIIIGDFTYTLVITNNNELALRVAEFEPPPPPPVTPTIAYVNSEWAGKAPGEIVTVGETTATIDNDAFDMLAKAEAAVTYDGAVEVVGGEISFADGYSKTITVDADATVVGKATFNRAITINGTIAFDTAYCNAYNAQFGGFSYVSGAATYTLNDTAPVAGTYLLASDAAWFSGNVAFEGNILTVGGDAVQVGDFVYTLTKENSVLRLNVEAYIPPPPPPTDIISGLVLGNGIRTVSAGELYTNTQLFYYGLLYVFSGGTANSTTVDSGGSFNVYSGGTANSTTVNSWGGMVVSNGGTANSTTVNSYGYLNVLSGGTANSTTVNSRGALNVYSGGTANNTTVNSGGRFNVYSGGTANNIVALSGAHLNLTVAPNAYIQGTSDGSAFEMKDAFISGYAVNSGGTLLIYSGGTATNIVENGGCVWIEDGASVTLVSNTFSGLDLSDAHATVHSGTTANSTTVNSGGMLQVSNGGTANSTTVNSSGYLYVSSGGTANSTTVNFMGYMLISSGGTANDTTVNEYGGLYVSSGGTANSTTVDSSGYLNVLSGGTANSTTVNSGGRFNVYNGGTANNTTVNFSSFMHVYSGGTANSTTVYADGEMSVFSGGSVNSTTVNVGGFMTVSNGGTVNNTVNEGVLNVSSGGTANSTTINVGGFMAVSSGGTANSTTVNVYGDLYVSSGGTANGTTVDSYGYMCVSNGGTANNTTVNTYAWFDVASGGTANGTTVNSDCEVTVSGGGTANNTTIKPYASITVSSGGIANNITINPYASLIVSSGGTAININWTPCEGTLLIEDGAVVSFVSQYSGVYLGSEGQLLSHAAIMDGKELDQSFEVNVMSGGTATNNTIGGGLYVLSGGTANSTTLKDWSSMYVSSGGTANSTTLKDWSSMYVSSCGTANATMLNGGELHVSISGTVNNTVNDGGGIYVYSGGTANATTVNNGSLEVSSGGTASETTLKDWSSMYVSKGGTAISTMLNDGGMLYVSSGGTATNNTVNSVGSLEVSSGGTANNTTVNDGGFMSVSDGGKANSATVNLNGDLYVWDGGTATNIVENGGYVEVEDGASVTFVANTFSGLVLDCTSATVHSGTTANSTTLNGGGLCLFSGGTANSVTAGEYSRLFINSGGKLTGQITVENGAYGTIERGAIIDFDISNLAAGAAARINNLALLGNNQEWKNADYTITVSASTQAAGKYTLAQGALNFNKTITVQDTFGNELGTVGIGYETLYAGHKRYTLDLVGDSLVLTVENGDRIAPKLSYLKLETTEKILPPITIYVDFEDNLDELEFVMYKIGDDPDAEWESIFLDSIEVTENTTVYFKGIDFDGNESEIVSCRVANIIPPTSYGHMVGLGETCIVRSQEKYAVTAISGGCMYISSGGTAYRTSVDLCYQGNGFRNGVVEVLSGGLASDTTVNSFGSVHVSSGGTADLTTLNSGGCLYVSSCGTATEIVENGGYVEVGDEAAVTFRQNSIPNFLPYSDRITMHSGTTADGVQLYHGGRLLIYSGAVADNIIAGVNASIIVYSGGRVNKALINYYGRLNPDSGGTMYVSSGGVANSTTVSLGDMYVSSGGTATMTMVSSGGSLNLCYGGVTSITTVRSGGVLNVYGRSKLTGRTIFEDGAVVSTNDGVIIDFDISGLDPDASARFNNLSIIQGLPTYTVTVSSLQKNGKYTLATQAAFFNDTITVQNTLGESLGTLAVDEKLKVGKREYSLTVSGDALTLSVSGNVPVDKVAPTVSNVKADITTATNLAVTVTAVFADDVELSQSLFRIGANGEWSEYIDGVTVTENTTIYFKAVDAAGNESAIKSYKVTNIKKADPIIVPDVPDSGDNENADDGTVNGSIFDDRGNVKEHFAESTGTVIDGDTGSIVLDEGVSQPDDAVGTYNNFVGYGDAVDYAKFTLEKAANLSFDISSTDAVKFTIYTLDEKTKKLKALQTTTLKKTDGSKPTAAKLLEAGEYYISMQSTNAKKADSAAFYNVELGMADLYLDGDDRTNDWLYEGGKKGRGLNQDVAGEGVMAKEISRASTGRQVQIDAKAVEHDASGKHSNFVGFGDTADYVKIHLDTAANLSLTIAGDKAAKLTICQLTYKNEVVNGSKTLVTTVLKAGNGSAASKLKLLDAGDYYVAVTATNAKKGDEAYYNVSVTSNSVFFDNCDDHANDWLYEKVTNKGGRGENTALVNSTGITLVDTLKNVQIDASVPTGEPGGWKNFVGYGDVDDYQKIVVKKDGATVSFKVDAKDQAKFVIYSYDKAANKVKALQTSKLKKDGDIYTVTTAEYTFKTAGEYFIAVTSTNAKKGGNAYYNVELVSTNVTAADLLGDALAADLAMPETASGLNLTDDLSFGQYGADALADASASSLAELDDKSAWQNLAKLA